MALRQFRVTVVKTVEAEFNVEANTPEEAESIVEGWMEDGESGTTVSSNLEMIEAIPEEDIEADERQED